MDPTTTASRFRVTSPDMTPEERRKIYRRRQYERAKAKDPEAFNRKSAEAWRKLYHNSEDFRKRHSERRNQWAKENRAKKRAEKEAAAQAKETAVHECVLLKQQIEELNAQLARLKEQTNAQPSHKGRRARKSTSKHANHTNDTPDKEDSVH